ncbi:tRNA lysidine(34) synthetase TilS [Chelativorans sp.]|uniref:tRNA lysidine(34) synthetase TilS n=1 Tax=Chelativorans sp. TaxID=2203393 RepID=UPI002810D8FF|nr:tRNA lysidine(34) synthetase TilS [Chelativorans sp.]
MRAPGALFSGIDFARHRTVLAAVSGGGDSLALLFLLHEHLRTIASGPSLLAVTVDHGLRAGSAGEAREVGRLAAAHGIAHRVLNWEGGKPASGLSAAAREARLALLARAAREAGAGLVFTGHTADDQAETLAMRLARGGGRGAAGIAPATLVDGGVWFLRPLLGTRRATLRAFLRERGISWMEDPSNHDPRFERARIRAALDETAIGELLAAARTAAEARERLGLEAAGLIEAAAERAAPGLLRVPLEALAGSEAGLYAFRILLAVVGGAEHLPDLNRAAALLGRAGEQGFRATLSGAAVTARRGDVYFHRERRNLPASPAADGTLWDGRYRIAVRESLPEGTLAAFGAENARTAELPATDAPRGLVRAALAAEPALHAGGPLVGLAASLPQVSIEPVPGPWARLLPSFDLAPAGAVAALLGAREIPPSPWEGHKRAMG